MKIKSNRFAILPIECNICQNYVWLEPYRIGEEWYTFLDTFVKVKICRDCYKRYGFGNDTFIIKNFLKNKDNVKQSVL